MSWSVFPSSCQERFRFGWEESTLWTIPEYSTCSSHSANLSQVREWEKILWCTGSKILQWSAAQKWRFNLLFFAAMILTVCTKKFLHHYCQITLEEHKMNGCTNALKKLNSLINISNATLIMQGNINPFQVLNDNNLYITFRDVYKERSLSDWAIL